MDRRIIPVSELETMGAFDDSIVYPEQEVDERGIVELVHDGYLGRGFVERAEAHAKLGKGGHRAVVHGEDGKWYCLALRNARKYNLAVDVMKRRKQ